MASKNVLPPPEPGRAIPILIIEDNPEWATLVARVLDARAGEATTFIVELPLDPGGSHE